MSSFVAWLGAVTGSASLGINAGRLWLDRPRFNAELSVGEDENGTSWPVLLVTNGPRPLTIRNVTLVVDAEETTSPTGGRLAAISPTITSPAGRASLSGGVRDRLLQPGETLREQFMSFRGRIVEAAIMDGHGRFYIVTTDRPLRHGLRRPRLLGR